MTNVSIAGYYKSVPRNCSTVALFVNVATTRTNHGIEMTLIEEGPSDGLYARIVVNDSLMWLSVHFSSCGVQTLYQLCTLGQAMRAHGDRSIPLGCDCLAPRRLSSKFGRLFFCNADERILMKIQQNSVNFERNNYEGIFS